MVDKCAPEDNGLVRKTVRAAEAEARTANTSAFAIRAVGDALAEVVKTAALEEYKKFTAEEAVVTAASTAASTVINTADTVAVARNTSKLILIQRFESLWSYKLMMKLFIFLSQTVIPLQS